jgi:hypothetical protein
MIAVARLALSEQIFAIVLRAWWGPCKRNDHKKMSLWDGRPGSHEIEHLARRHALANRVKLNFVGWPGRRIISRTGSYVRNR